MNNNALESILNEFSPISLKEMDSVKLMNRTDTKYFFHSFRLIDILTQIKLKYRILTVEKKRIASYKTLYFDTKDFSCYSAHHNGKLNRHKVRIRQYVDSGLFFLEQKRKDNKGRTIKKRIRTDKINLTLLDNEKNFINDTTFLDAEELNSVLFNEFERITLVDSINKERITIDFNLKFYNNENSIKTLENIVIIEIKKDVDFSHSIMKEIMRKERIFPSGFSKYCTGIICLYDNIKYNRFKHRFSQINKINYATP